MVEFYSEIRLVHIAAVLLSGSLFLVRGLALLWGASWTRAAPLRYLGYSLDTVLLTAALMLMTITQQYPFVDAWLTVKLLLLIVYIAMGMAAFGQSVPQPRRFGLWLAALAVYAFIISVARAHDPIGAFGALLA